MIPRAILTAARLGFSALTLVAIGFTLWTTFQKGTLDVVNFFSFFTILSNLLAVVSLVGSATRGDRAASRTWDLVRGQAVVMMTVTLVVYARLLADADVSLNDQWVNVTLHRLFPIVVIADWLLDPPGSSVSLRDSLVWLAFPLVWTGYTLVRGALVGWYPYPFLDPANGGYATVAAYILGILVFGAIVSAIVALAGNAMRGRRPVAAPA
jgi:hypothetical protein